MANYIIRHSLYVRVRGLPDHGECRDDDSEVRLQSKLVRQVHLHSYLHTFLPTYYLPTYLPTYLDTYLPTYNLTVSYCNTYITYLHTFLPTYYLPTYIHTYLDTYLPTYNLTVSYCITYNKDTSFIINTKHFKSQYFMALAIFVFLLSIW